MNTFRRGRGLVASGLPRTAERKQEDPVQGNGDVKTFSTGNPVQITSDKPIIGVLKVNVEQSAKQVGDGSFQTAARPTVEEVKKSDDVAVPANNNATAIKQVPVPSRGAFSRGRILRGVILNQGERRQPQSDLIQHTESISTPTPEVAIANGAFYGHGSIRDANTGGGAQINVQTSNEFGDQPPVIAPASRGFSRGRGRQNLGVGGHSGIQTNSVKAADQQPLQISTGILTGSASRDGGNGKPGFGSGFGRGSSVAGGNVSASQINTFPSGTGGRARGTALGSGTRGGLNQTHGIDSGQAVKGSKRIEAENPGWDDEDDGATTTPSRTAPDESNVCPPIARGGFSRGRGGHGGHTCNSKCGPEISGPPQISSGTALDGGGALNQNRSNNFGRPNHGRSTGAVRQIQSSNQNRTNGFGDGRRTNNESGHQSQQLGADRPPPPNNPDPNRKPASTYVPHVRSIEEIVKEDVEQRTYYETIADEDEDVTASFAGFKHKHIVAIDTWTDAKFGEVLYNNIVDQCKYVRPRKIQAHAIPLILEGSDLKGLAETGSGKTAAFMLPIIDMVMKCKKEVNLMDRPAPHCIIIEPTRELCKQVYEQGLKFANGTGVGVKKAYGETDVRRNRNELREGDGCDILCVTVGRFKHLICDNWIDYAKIKILVFDEADQLLENDFLKTVNEVLRIPAFPQKEARQTLMFSATFPAGVQKLADETMKKESAMISKGAVVSANIRIAQTFISVDSKKKKSILLDLLRREINNAVENNVEIPRFLVFVSRKKTADLLSLYYSQQGIKATTINGDRDQSQRETALREFAYKDAHVLISTDVCARGIDIKNLDHVINYDLPRFKGEGPKDADDNEYDERPVTYVQRIGRTGRLRPGTAISFFDELDDNDREFAAKLVGLVRGVGQEPPDFVTKAADDFARVSSFVPPENPWGDDEDDDDVPIATPIVIAPIAVSADADDWS